jgi:hypothetical protein
MSLVAIEDGTFINEDAIAWVQFSSQDGQPQATVHFLVAHPQQGEFIKHTFVGSAADGLRDLGERIETAGIEPSQGGARGKNVTAVDLRPIRKKKAWFFSPFGDRPLILALVNAKGACSVRSYDAGTGFFVGKTYRSGDYQDAFSDLVGASVELIIDTQPNLERDCRERLPETVMDRLKPQIERINVKHRS